MNDEAAPPPEPLPGWIDTGPLEREYRQVVESGALDGQVYSLEELHELRERIAAAALVGFDLWLEGITSLECDFFSEEAHGPDAYRVSVRSFVQLQHELAPEIVEATRRFLIEHTTRP